MKLVIDTNIVIATLVKASKTREMLLNPGIEPYAPEYLFEEIEEHRQEIRSKAGITDAEFNSFIITLRRVITTVPKRTYADYAPEAMQLISDPDDVPFVALAIALSGTDGDCDIWSNDKHFEEKEIELFKKFRIKVFTTETLYGTMKK